MNRYLPLSQKLLLLLGGTWKFALGLTIVGLVIAYFTLTSIDLQEIVYLRGSSVAIGSGEIMDMYATSTSINEEPVMGYEYVFHSPIGDLFWTSYSHTSYADVGDVVEIEYHVDRPYVHRIKGMRNSVSGWLNFLLLIPLFIGLFWIFVNIRIGLKRISIISYGQLADAKLLSKDETGVQINEEPQYKYTFEYEAQDGKNYHATHRTTDDLGTGNRQVIYNALRPEKAVIVNFLPASMRQLVEQWR